MLQICRGRAPMAVVGMSASVFTLARQKYLTEAVPVEFRARALSTLGGVNRIGIFIGPLIGAAVMQFVGISGAYWVGMAGMMAAAVIAVSIPDLAIADGTSDPAEPSPTLCGVALSYALRGDCGGFARRGRDATGFLGFVAAAVFAVALPRLKHRRNY